MGIRLSSIKTLIRVYTDAIQHYTENFIQATLTAMPGGAKGKTLVVGGDGRYYASAVYMN